MTYIDEESEVDWIPCDYDEYQEARRMIDEDISYARRVYFNSRSQIIGNLEYGMIIKLGWGSAVAGCCEYWIAKHWKDEQ